MCCRFWADEKVSDWPDDQKLLALYLLTCEHRTQEGIYRLPKVYAQADLGWSDRRVASTLSALESRGFLAYDEQARVVLLKRALKYNPPKGPKQITGAVRRVCELPDTPLLIEFARVCETLAPSLARAFDGVPEGYRNPFDRVSIAQTEAQSQTQTETQEEPGSGDAPDPYSRESWPEDLQEIFDLLSQIQAPRDGEPLFATSKRKLKADLWDPDWWRTVDEKYSPDDSGVAYFHETREYVLWWKSQTHKSHENMKRGLGAWFARKQREEAQRAAREAQRGQRQWR